MSSTVRAGARLRVATKYVQTAREHFAAKGVHVDLIKLYGSMELAPLTGLADAIVDLVSTGQHAEGQQSRRGGRHLPISARLIVNQAAYKLKRDADAAAARPAERAAASNDCAQAAESRRDPRIRRAARGVARLRSRAGSGDRCDGRGILADVRQRGDAAVLEYTRRFDRLQAASVAAARIHARRNAARARRAASRRNATRSKTAAARVRTYHERQGAQSWSYTDEDGTRTRPAGHAARPGRHLRAGRQGRLSVVGADERVAGASRRRARDRHGGAHAGRRAQSAGARCRRARRRRPRLRDRRRAGDRARSRTAPRRCPRSTRSSGPATPMSPPPSAACSA